MADLTPKPVVPAVTLTPQPTPTPPQTPLKRHHSRPAVGATTTTPLQATPQTPLKRHHSRTAAASAASAKLFEVAISSAGFNPSRAKIKAGGTVKWRNDDTVPHFLTFDAGIIADRLQIEPGAVVERVFAKAGVFTYHCQSQSGMTGTVIVK